MHKNESYMPPSSILCSNQAFVHKAFLKWIKVAFLSYWGVEGRAGVSLPKVPLLYQTVDLVKFSFFSFGLKLLILSSMSHSSTWAAVYRNHNCGQRVLSSHQFLTILIIVSQASLKWSWHTVSEQGLWLSSKVSDLNTEGPRFNLGHLKLTGSKSRWKTS